MKDINWNKSIGEKLRKLRVNNNYSQATIAYCLNISRNAFMEWENGNIDFTLAKLHQINS